MRRGNQGASGACSGKDDPMLPTLLPGTNRDNVLKSLRAVHTAAFNLRGSGATVALCVE
jgi:hypothetical protein